MVGDDADLLPACRQQGIDAIDEVRNQLRDAAGQTTPLMVASCIEIAVFSPGSARRVADVGRAQDLKAFIHEQLTEPIGGQVFAVTGHTGAELFSSGHPGNVPGYG